MRQSVLATLMCFPLLFSASASAQQLDCRIGAYLDDGGEISEASAGALRDFPFFDVYYVVLAEDFMNAVAFQRGVYAFDPLRKPLATGFSIDGYGTFLDVQPDGFQIGLGACLSGFGGQPIAVMRETFVFPAGFTPCSISVEPNFLEYPDYPIYNSCVNELLPCHGSSLYLHTESNDSESWGAIKSLYAEPPSSMEGR